MVDAMGRDEAGQGMEMMKDLISSFFEELKTLWSRFQDIMFLENNGSQMAE